MENRDILPLPFRDDVLRSDRALLVITADGAENAATQFGLRENGRCRRRRYDVAEGVIMTMPSLS